MIRVCVDLCLTGAIIWSLWVFGSLGQQTKPLPDLAWKTVDRAGVFSNEVNLYGANEGFPYFNLGALMREGFLFRATSKVTVTRVSANGHSTKASGP